jgi:hypothetical protein
LRSAVHYELEEDGYLVIEAAGGDEAVERCSHLEHHRSPPDDIAQIARGRAGMSAASAACLPECADGLAPPGRIVHL